MAEHNITLRCSKCCNELQIDEFIECTKCYRRFHYCCVDMSEDIRLMLKEIGNSFYWFCESCRKSSCPQPVDDASENSSTTTPSPSSSSSNITSFDQPFTVLPPNSKSDSAINEKLKGEGDTRVNIKHAKTVNNYLHTACQNNVSRISSCGTYHKETIRRICLKNLKRKYAIKKANVSTILFNGEKHEYPMGSYFIELKVEEKDMLGSVTERNLSGLSEIFQGERIYQNILMTGDSGYGKTTLVEKLCYDWARLPPTKSYMSNFDMVVNIPLRNVGDISIEQAILDEICSSEEERSLAAVILEGLKILVILDGLDEIVERENVLSFLDNPIMASKGFHCNFSLLVTSRPYAVSNLRRLFDRRLSILGFSGEFQKLYIKKVLPDIQASILIKRIEEHPFLQKASECPLILHLLCCVHGNDSNPMISSRTVLYLEILKLLVHRYASKNRENKICKRLMETTVVNDSFIIRLGEIAFNHIFYPSKSITEERLKNQFEDEEFQLIIGLGILVTNPVLSNMKIEIAYEFIHLTFGEFLASIYLANNIIFPALNPDPEHHTPPFFIKDNLLLFTLGILDQSALKGNALPVLRWLATSRTLPELLEIKKEAGLRKESLELFLSYVESIEYNHRLNECSLPSELALPNINEIKITSQGSGNELWECIKSLLNSYQSCSSLIVGINVDAISYSTEKSVYDFHFLCCEGLISRLTEVRHMMRSRERECHIQVLLLSSSDGTERNAGEKKNREVENKLRGVNSTGFLPECMFIPKGIDHVVFYYGQHNPFFKWEVFYNVNIFYCPHLSTKEKNRLLIPILVSSPKENNTIVEKPFFPKSCLAVSGFKNIQMTCEVDYIKLPKKFGQVSRNAFFECLNKYLRTPRFEELEEIHGYNDFHIERIECHPTRWIPTTTSFQCLLCYLTHREVLSYQRFQELYTVVRTANFTSA